MRIITASYIVYADFKVPDNVPLLSIKENDKVKDHETPWSWWIKYNVLYYVDAEKNIQHIDDICDDLPLFDKEGSEITFVKRPDDISDHNDDE